MRRTRGARLIKYAYRRVIPHRVTRLYVLIANYQLVPV